MLYWGLAPAEGHSAWAVSSLLDQRLVKLTARARVDLSPAVLAVVLEACDVSAEEWCELSTASSSLAFVAHLIIKNVGFHFNL